MFRIVIVSILIVLSKLSYDYAQAREVFSAAKAVQAKKTDIFQAQERLACIRTKSIPHRYCKMRSSENVVDRRFEWVNNEAGLQALLAETYGDDDAIEEWGTRDPLL